MTTTHQASAVLSISDLSFSYGQTPVLRGVTLPPLEPGSVTALVGPNGAGKSTLLRCAAGLEHHTGTVEAPSILYLPQDPPPVSSLTVFESVLLAHLQGRSGFGALRVSRVARLRVAEVLGELGIAELAGHTMGQLSGGQRQLVSFAQAVIRQPAALLLDEPTSALDLRNQLVLLRLIRAYATGQQAAVVMAIHDLGQAARFADTVVVLSDGTVHSSGPGEDVITPVMLRDVYRVEASVHYGVDGGIAIDTWDAF